jgi:mediator of replication checkpoint protein 1
MTVHEAAEEEEEAEEAAAEQEEEPDAGSTLLEDTQVTENDTLSLPSLIPAAPAHKPINAFDTLMASKGQPSVPDRRAGAGGRTTIDAQGFLEDQADESEEEDAFGIGGHSDDEPEDGEEGDGVIEGLVDDQEMTEAEKEADRRAVQEKHR